MRAFLACAPLLFLNGVPVLSRFQIMDEIAVVPCLARIAHRCVGGNPLDARVMYRAQFGSRISRSGPGSFYLKREDLVIVEFLRLDMA